MFLCYFQTKYFTAVLGLLPVLLDRVHPVELGQSHLPYLAVHQGCPTNLPETFHPGSFALYFRLFYSHSFTGFSFLQIFLPIFSNKIKNDMPTGATFENKSPLMDEQILFSLHFRTDNGDQFHPVLSTCNVSFPSIHL